MKARDAKGFRVKFDIIRNRYVSGLPARIADLESALKSARIADGETNAQTGLSDLKHIAHKLAGSGASFGFHAISDTARHLELACAPAQDGYSLRPETLREIEKIVGSLKVEIESIGSQSPDVLENIKPKIFRPNEQSKSVLLVEDDKDQAEQLKRGLSTFGYDLEIIDEPADITRAVEKFQPAAIILDLDICGNRTAVSDAVRRLRSAVGIECPVIATTEHSGFEARLAAVRAGCVAFLPKPLNITEIVHILDTATDQGEDEPQRILMIDDDPDVTQFVTFVLRSAGMISEGLSNPYLVLEKLEDFSPELILIDLWMPRCSGKEIAAIIRQQSKYSSLPIVFLSGETDTDVQLEAMDEGGGDFITKPVNPKHLVSTIRSRVARFRMLRDQMVRDSMTGLFNHATTKEMLETEIERARRSGARLTFAMLDIDRFKSVNDTHGHGVGDMVIKTLTRILTSRLRRVDIVGRLGGEEFGVVLGETSGDRAIEVMEDIRTTFETTPHQAGESTFHVTVSCGIAEFPTFDSTIPLSEAADHALYEAKSSGRNRVVLAKNSISSSDGLQ